MSADTALVSRFYIDSKFRKKSKEMYKIWINNILQDKNGIIVICLVDKEIAGLVAGRPKNGIGVIELVKTGAKFEGLGVATHLVMRLVNAFFDKGVNIINVTTQLENEAARHLYEKCGFSTKKSIKIYHWWKKH